MDRRVDKARGKMSELPYWSRAESRNSQGMILIRDMCRHFRAGGDLYRRKFA